MGQPGLLQASSFLLCLSSALYLLVLIHFCVSLVIKVDIHDAEECIGQKEVDMKFMACFFFTLLPIIFSSLYYLETRKIIREGNTKDDRVPISPNSGFFVKFFLGQTGEVSILPPSHRNYIPPSHWNYSTSNIVTVVSEMAILLLGLVIVIIILGFREEWTLLWKMGAPNDRIYLVLELSMWGLLVGTFGSTMSILAIKLARIQNKKDLYTLSQQAGILVLSPDFKLLEIFIAGESKFQQVIDAHNSEVSDSDDDYSE